MMRRAPTARGTVGIVGDIEHEYYVPHPENGGPRINV
jgi:hypothetical protein